MSFLNRLTGVLVVALVLVGISVVTTAAGSTENDQFMISAVFDDASPIIPGNQVKASGVTVGSVVATTLENGQGVITMTVDSAVLPLHEDARAIITAKDLLGERFINLERGTPDSPVMQGPYRIAKEQTETTIDLQDVFNELDDPTSASFAAFLTTLGEGVRGRGPEVAQALEALAPSMRQADQLAKVVSEQNQVLTSLVDNLQPVTAELAAGRGQALDQLVGSATRTLGAVATNRQAVVDSLQRLPGTLQKAQRTLAQVSGVANTATPSLEAIRPVTDDLVEINRELREFSDAADPALASLPPVLERFEDLIDEAAPLVDDLRPVGPDLKTTAEGLRRGCKEGVLCLRWKNVMEFAKMWALSTSGYDGLSHYFRTFANVTPKALGQAGAGPIPGAPDTPIQDSGIPRSGRLPLPGNCQGEQNHPCEDEDGPPTIADENGTGPGSATGLTPGQESRMLDQVLGGN